MIWLALRKGEADARYLGIDKAGVPFHKIASLRLCYRSPSAFQGEGCQVFRMLAGFVAWIIWRPASGLVTSLAEIPSKSISRRHGRPLLHLRRKVTGLELRTLGAPCFDLVVGSLAENERFRRCFGCRRPKVYTSIRCANQRHERRQKRRSPPSKAPYILIAAHSTSCRLLLRCLPRSHGQATSARS